MSTGQAIDRAGARGTFVAWSHAARALRGELAQLCAAVPEDTAAAVMWSILVEPGDRIAWQLIDQYGYAASIARLQQYLCGGGSRGFEDTVVDLSALAEAGARWSARLNPERFGQVVRSARSLGIRLLLATTDGWPTRLERLGEHAPLVLWYLGERDTISARHIAFVGARASTGYGEHVTTELVVAATHAHLGVVSGGAYGIDGAAHRAALRYAAPTIAVLAGGLDRLYPRGHEAMLRNIVASGGALIAEVPPATAPTRWRFLQRNRNIAALAEAVIVVEAGFRSGALNTAHHALELGVPVGAVPGSVLSAQSAGCHRLFQEGLAACVTSGTDVLELAGIRARQQAEQAAELSILARRVLDSLNSHRALPESDIAARAGCSMIDAALALGQLELAQLVIRDGAGWRQSQQD